jgi:hypothetical protein
MVLFVIAADLRPSPDLSDDEAAFDAAMNANPEVKEWAMKTLETARIRPVAEIKAECVVAREWLIARGDPDFVDDLATLEAYAAGFDEKGITSAAARHTPPRLQHPGPDASPDEALKGLRTRPAHRRVGRRRKTEAAACPCS